MQKPGAERKTVLPDSKPGVETARPTNPTAPGRAPNPPAAGAQRARIADPGKTRLLREGTFLVSRQGRVVRSAGGEWLFAFDSDTQGLATNDPTMVIMPCEKLMGIERIAEKHGEDISYTMTGQVFVYNGRNYLLPTNYIVNRPSGDVKTMQ